MMVIPRIMRGELFFGVLLLGVVGAFYWDNDDQEHKPTVSVTCDCGWANRDRIVGGKETGKNEYPMMAVLLNATNKHQFCGGTIITQKHILTAAHCTDGLKPNDFFVAVGAHNLRDKGEYEREILKVGKIINHEQYNFGGWESNDISLLVMEDKIKFKQHIGPACLPNVRVHLDNEQIKILGWGLTKPGTEYYSPILQEVELKVLGHIDCLKSWKNTLRTNPINQICTFAKGKDSCQVDSGGPLIWMDSEIGRYTLVGLVSYGGECAGSQPGVNTDVSFHLGWINSKIAETAPELHVCTKN